MVVSTIRDEIITEIGGDTDDTALQTKILQFMNSALRRFPLWSRQRFAIKTVSGTLSSGSYYMTMPTGLISERDVYYISESNRIRIDRAPTNEYFNDDINTSATGDPEFYRIVGTRVEFTRTANASYTIYFEGQAEQDHLTATDTWGGDTMTAEVLKDGAKYYYYQYAEDIETAKNYLTMFKNGLDELDAKYMASELGSHIDEE